MQGKLIYSGPSESLFSAKLVDETVRIGRSAGCQIASAAPGLLDEHCAIKKEGDVWFAEALHSDGPVYINDREQPITRHPLRHRDVIRCGSLWLQLILDEETLPKLDGAAVPESVQAVLATAAQELLQHKALVQIRDAEKQALTQELSALKSTLGDAKPSSPASAVSSEDAGELRETTERLRAQCAALETELATQKRECTVARVEFGELKAQAEAASQKLNEQTESVALLLSENKKLVADMERLRAILDQKDQLIAEAKEAPQALVTELAQLRLQHEQAAARLVTAEAEREAARAELARRSIAHEQAEEELRRLRVEAEALKKVAVGQHDASADLAKTAQENSVLSQELLSTRAELEAVRKQLADGLASVSKVVTELGARFYALRAAVARLEPPVADRRTISMLAEALDEILEHQNTGDAELRGLRKLAKDQGIQALGPSVTETQC